MYHLEQREKFWDSKVEDLKTKLHSRHRLGKSNNPPLKPKPSHTEANYEELRLMNSLAKEEISELKSLLSTEKSRCQALHKKNEDMRLKVEELQDLNQSLTNVLVDKEKFSENSKISLKSDQRAQESFKDELALYQEKLKTSESEKKNNKELFEARLKALQNELVLKEQQLIELQDIVKTSNKQQYIDHSICESRLSECFLKIQTLESQLIQKNSSRPGELNKKLQVLEEENQILKEQIEIYQEDQQKKMIEKEKLQKLSYMILSKDKKLEPEAMNLVRKTLGDTQANIIETLYEKSQNSDQECKSLSQKLAQEYAGKVENLEKIKNLQETLAKIAPDCGYDSDLPKIKAQIVAAKALASGNTIEKNASGMEYYEKSVENDILKADVKGLRAENVRLREERDRIGERMKELQEKVNALEARVDDKDILCFIQCEAAALEDILAESDSQDLMSEDFY